MPSVDLPSLDAMMSPSRTVDDCNGLDQGLTASHDSDRDESSWSLHSGLRRKRTSTSSLTPKKKLRADGSPASKPIVDENANDIQRREETDHEKNSIDYLSLQPERIVSITRSRLPSQQLEFLLKCSQCPTKLFFISNEQAKELMPDLLIEFYEKHINWFIDRPPSRRPLRSDREIKANERVTSRIKRIQADERLDGSCTDP